MSKRYAITRRWRSRNPWFNNLRAARERCNNKNNRNYPNYGGLGIKCRLTISEIKKLWMRDGAAHMAKPSLDRIDPELDYSFSNCQFIEFNENTAKAHRDRAEKNPLTYSEDEKNEQTFV